MKNLTAIAAGVVVAIGTISTVGAWYTGTQLDGVLQGALEEANQQSQAMLLGSGMTSKLELLSLETGLFSSTAHYRLTYTVPEDEQSSEPQEVLLVDNIEHGPLPVSRLLRFKLWPVMAASNYALETNPLTQKWFDAANGAAPLWGKMTLGYDGSTTGTLTLIPVEFTPTPTAEVKFSGLALDFHTSKNAERVAISGGMDSLIINAVDDEQTPVHAELRGLALNLDQHLSSGDFYVGDSSAKLLSAQFEVGEQPAILFKDLSHFGNMQEVSGLLGARMGYDIGAISYRGKELAGMQLHVSLKNIDVLALKSLRELYRDKFTSDPQGQGVDAGAADTPFTPEQDAQLKAGFEQLLAAKPQVALEKLSIKTTSGKALLSVAIDLNKPESFELPLAELAKQMIVQLDSKLSVAKPMIGDGVRAQAMIAGETDAKAIEDQALMLTEVGSQLALGTGLVKQDGDTLQSSLHYAKGTLTLNGQDMSVDEFLMLAMSGVGSFGTAGDQPQGQTHQEP